MKTLVLYYSFDGYTEAIAKAAAEVLGADLERLMPEKELETHGFMKYVWGGRQAMMREKPALKPLQHSIDDYDLIVLGSPVWAFTISPPMRSFLSAHSLKGKKVALFICHGGGPRHALDDFKAAAKEAVIIGEADFIDFFKKKTEEQVEKAKEWARRLAITPV